LKKRFIITLLLLSLFLNISHDFILLKKSSNRCKVFTLLIEKDIEHNCCQNSVEIHKSFHFVAILLYLKIFFIRNRLSISVNSESFFEKLNLKLFKPPQI